MRKGYRPEIGRALRFIADNLQRPLSVAEVARAAHLSEFHLHRVFHAAVGESVGRFVTRQRLERAALSLAYELDQSITDVALSSGYSSSSNFSKAFAAYFGCSPTRVRQPELGLPPSIGTLSALHGGPFRPEALYSLPPEVSAEERAQAAAVWQERVRYETSEGLDFACLASPAGYDFDAVERTWHELIERAYQLGLASGPVDAWGIAHDSPDITAPDLCRYHACVPCAPGAALPAPLFGGRMLPGRYAVFRYAGPVAEVGAAYRSIYSCWFRESSLAPADFVPIDHYITDAPRDGAVELEVWFRVRARR